LDDISQPDIGGGGDHLSGAEQGSMSESESEGSIKKEGLHDAEGEPLETPYIHHDEVEEFGSVIICYSFLLLYLGEHLFLLTCWLAYTLLPVQSSPAVGGSWKFLLFMWMECMKVVHMN
jgi:hypothetical protein